MKMISLHCTVTGRVQGVGFRYFTHSNAQSLKITGYVKNLADGNVEIYAEGGEQIMAKFYQSVQKGPSFSNVIDIQADWFEISEKKYNDFSIKY